MHLELTEVLTCPTCGPSHGLIAFVDRMEERRIVEGRLDCPMCERRHVIRRGVVYLGVEPPTSDSNGADEAGEAPGTADREGGAAELAAALLGPPEGPELLALAAGAEELAAAIASLRPRATILAVSRARSSPHARSPSIARVHGRHQARVHRVVLPGPPDGARLPLRPGRLDGIVLAGPGVGPPDGADLAAAASALRPGARLVILEPGEAPPDPEPAGVRLLAADDRARVAERI